MISTDKQGSSISITVFASSPLSPTTWGKDDPDGHPAEDSMGASTKMTSSSGQLIKQSTGPTAIHSQLSALQLHDPRNLHVPQQQAFMWRHSLTPSVPHFAPKSIELVQTSVVAGTTPVLSAGSFVFFLSFPALLPFRGFLSLPALTAKALLLKQISIRLQMSMHVRRETIFDDTLPNL
jgi:hypothetical protein